MLCSAHVFSDSVGCLAHVRLTAGAKLRRYLHRLVHVSHMDFELALWQMVYLLARPQQVYRNFMYRKRECIIHCDIVHET